MVGDVVRFATSLECSYDTENLPKFGWRVRGKFQNWKAQIADPDRLGREAVALFFMFRKSR